MPLTLERIPHDKQVAVHTLHSLNYSIRKIAKVVDVSPNTVQMVIKQVPADLSEIDTYKKRLLSWNYGISQRSLHRITDDKLNAMNALQLMTISAIGIDKARDIEGLNRPQFNIVNVVADCESTRNKLEARMLALQEQKTTLNAGI